jgi:hypothetical protein
MSDDTISIGGLNPRPPRPKNLKAGDRVKFIGAGPNCTEGVIDRIDGHMVYIVCLDKENYTFFEIERFRDEITERTAEFQPIPCTQIRLKYLLEMAEPETEERQRRRVDAQEELMSLLNQGQIFRNSRGVWCLDPTFGLEKYL